MLNYQIRNKIAPERGLFLFQIIYLIGTIYIVTVQSFKLILDDFTWNFTKISEIPSKSWSGSFSDFVKEYADENGKN